MVKPMDGDVPNETVSEFGEVEDRLDPSRRWKRSTGAMKATRAVKRITFNQK